MPAPREIPLRMVPRSVSDVLDGDNAPPGAMFSLSNLIFDPSTPGAFQCRPANFKLTDFSGFTSPGIVSVSYQMNGVIYGMIASGSPAGKDRPFAYNIATSTFLTINGITSANTPTTPSSTGQWTPPTMEVVGTKIIVTHPGFNYAGGYAFGYLDISGFSATPTGTTDGTTAVITGVSSTAGVSPGYTISGTGIPAGATVINVTSNTITISANTTSAHTNETLTITGGSQTTPLWCAGNTTGALQLNAIPQAVFNFNNRAYFAIKQYVIFTDTLSLNISNAGTVQVLTIDDTSPVQCFSGLPFFTTSGGTIQALIVFKQYSIWQITGDASTSNLTVNQLAGTVGTDAPRSVVATPDGVLFKAVDGIRNINLSGEVSEPNPDLAIPFIYALYPSRCCASFNADTYRICVQNNAPGVVGTPYQDYHYNIKLNAWTGPHTFRYDSIVPYMNDFVEFNNSVPATMWQAFSVQDHNGQGNTFVENGTQLDWSFQTQPMTDNNNMYTNGAVRSTIDLALPENGGVFTFQAIDANGGVIAQGSYASNFVEAIWDNFDWGDGTEWGVQQLGLQPYTVPWTRPLVFNELIFQVSGQSSLGFKIGALYIGYEKLGYLKQ